MFMNTRIQEFILFTHFVAIYAYFYNIFINVHESKLIQYYIWGWGAKCITQYINSSLVRNVHYEVKAKVGCLCAGRLKSRSVQNVHFDARAELATCGCCCCHLGAQVPPVPHDPIVTDNSFFASDYLWAPTFLFSGQIYLLGCVILFWQSSSSVCDTSFRSNFLHAFNECKGAIDTHDRCGDISDFSTSEISCDKYEVYM